MLLISLTIIGTVLPIDIFDMNFELIELDIEDESSKEGKEKEKDAVYHYTSSIYSLISNYHYIDALLHPLNYSLTYFQDVTTPPPEMIDLN